MTDSARSFELVLATWDPELAGDSAADPVEVARLAELCADIAAGLPPALWHRYLDWTRVPRFLSGLPDRRHRERWAATAFVAIRASAYGLDTMLAQRARTHGTQIFLREARKDSSAWTFEQTAQRIAAIAAVVASAARGAEPRVAILADNSVDSACADLACLAYDAFVAPLDPHLDPATLAWVFDTVGINLAFAGSRQYAERLDAIRSQVKRPFRILHADPDSPATVGDDVLLAEAIARLGPDEIAEQLGGRRHRSVDEVATAMFTSGSTGQPKGVVFTAYNLLCKRFARGAALPAVGEREVLLCYLPLFHTFGRFLELMGSLYWGGSYVFAGNPSSENLISLLKTVQPTGLISVPLRWTQIRDACVGRFTGAETDQEQRVACRDVVGERLRWGLSAAGHLEPRTFRFFQRMGVALCSGFGMTEATGGITMTPPGEYVDGSVGVPLPGVRTRLSEIGELEISGAYVARYLDDPAPAIGEYTWLPTGDLFREQPGGFLEIVDRVKDIYKNSKGQTIAPRRVEQQFDGVPGIRRVFLVGDGREYNTLLIVPQRADPVLRSLPGEEEVREYFRQIVATGSQPLAKFERVVTFALLERDFELERGELTPKGSYRRKVIEEHFAPEIKNLYRSRIVELALGGLRVQIPRWFFRDQGWLDSDVEATADGLVARPDGRSLRVARVADTDRILVGDIEYRLRGDVVDLGLFARQPLLWVGNGPLAEFCPVKDGWDLSLGDVSPQIWLPPQRRSELPGAPDLGSRLGDARLGKAHDLAVQALFGSGRETLAATEQIAAMLERAHDRLAGVIRRRLEALARHPELEVRCLAYRLLLLDTLVPETSKLLPSFVEAGLPFLTAESIEAIARANLERQRLEAFRQRLYRYRTELRWPAAPPVRTVFGDILKLLTDFVRYHPDYFAEVRRELSAWMLHSADPDLAALASEHLATLTRWWEEHVLGPVAHALDDVWAHKVVYHERLTRDEIERLERVLRGTSFLQRSLMLAFDSPGIHAVEVADQGVWIARMSSFHHRVMFRVSINLVSGQHYDLLVVLADDRDPAELLKTVHWMDAVNAYPFGPPVSASFASYSSELGALSFAYVPDLTTHERIRGLAGLRVQGASLPGRSAWRKLFVRSMAAFITAWRNSGKRIIPGPLSQSNVVVFEPDFREDALVLSMAEWRPYSSPLPVAEALLHDFYSQTASQYPWCRAELDVDWLFDAWVEALGVKEACAVLRELLAQLGTMPLDALGHSLAPCLAAFLERLEDGYYLLLPLRCAIERYQELSTLNPAATARARHQHVDELRELYGIERLGELARFHLYRHTYFGCADPAVRACFDRLLTKMFREPAQRATAMVELSELQTALRDPEDRAVFTRMAFPHADPDQRLEVVATGPECRQVIVRSRIVDRAGAAYTVREPVDAAELGKLYRIYVMAGFPSAISPRNCFYVVLDHRDEVVGGVLFKREAPGTVQLFGIVVGVPLRGRGLNSALLEDFCRRMADQGIEVVRTYFLAREFYTRHGFRVDSRWGGLVRFPRMRPSPS